MSPETITTGWTKGDVDESRDHIVLTYGSMEREEPLEPVARVAQAREAGTGQFSVQFLPVPSWDVARLEAAQNAVRRELDFWLVGLRQFDPWAYAIYQGGTAANVYSAVHWGYYPAARLSPMVDVRFTYDGLATTSNMTYNEAAGTFWVWAWPELLGWRSDIVWLFSPVNDKKLWRGDLWGVDQHGELVLVETKRVMKGFATTDPYEDFVELEEMKAYPGVELMKKKWQRLHQSEQRFVRERQSDLQSGNRLLELWPGVVDHSRKRLMVWRWRELYLLIIAPFIQSGEYEQMVENNLQARHRAGNPPPHYFALFTRFDDTQPKFSARGKAHYDRLVELAGRSRVHARSVSAQPVEGGQVRIDSLPFILPSDLP